MAVRSIFNSNFTLNNLDVESINGTAYVPDTIPNLASVLEEGSSADSQSITGVNNIALTTINSNAYPFSYSVYTGATTTYTLTTSSGSFTIIPSTSLTAGTYMVTLNFKLTNNSSSSVTYGKVYFGVTNPNIFQGTNNLPQVTGEFDESNYNTIFTFTNTSNQSLTWSWGSATGINSQQTLQVSNTKIIRLF